MAEVAIDALGTTAGRNKTVLDRIAASTGSLPNRIGVPGGRINVTVGPAPGPERLTIAKRVGVGEARIPTSGDCNVGGASRDG